MLFYVQSTGRIYRKGSLCPLGIGWAGQGAGKNNPAMQNVKGIGPLPCGLYTFGKAYKHKKLGPVTMDLTPDPKNKMYGRSAFRIHGFGEDVEHASEGCIIQVRPVRELIDKENDRKLRVVANPAELAVWNV